MTHAASSVVSRLRRHVAPTISGAKCPAGRAVSQVPMSTVAVCNRATCNAVFVRARDWVAALVVIEGHAAHVSVCAVPIANGVGSARVVHETSPASLIHDRATACAV